MEHARFHAHVVCEVGLWLPPKFPHQVGVGAIEGSSLDPWTQPALTRTSLFPLVSSPDKYGCGHSTQLLFLLHLKPDQHQFDVSWWHWWAYASHSVGRRMGTSPPFILSVSNQLVVPVARLIVRPLTNWNRRLQVVNMTIDLVATDLPLAITHDLCDQSYVLSTIWIRLVYDSKLFWTQLRRNLVVRPVWLGVEHDVRPGCDWFCPGDHPRPLRPVVRPIYDLTTIPSFFVRR